MSSAGGAHPRVMDFMINKEQALELEVKDLSCSVDAVVQALFRDREKCKALGIPWGGAFHNLFEDFFNTVKRERDARKTETFKELVRTALGG